MMSTETAVTSAMLSAKSTMRTTRPKRHGAMAITMGTNTPLILSARRAIGALLPWASCTSRTICWSAESAPTFVAASRSAGRVHRRAKDAVARRLLDRYALAGEHGLVHGGLAALYVSITGIFSRRAHQHTVAHDHGFDWHVLLGAVAHDTSGPSLRADETLDGRLVRPVARASKYLPIRIRTMMTAAAS